MYVNQKWCHTNNVTVKHTSCSPCVEMLTLGMRPYYLPREFSHVLTVAVYVPPSANATEAAETIAQHVHELQTRSPDAFILVTGDRQPL